MGQEGDGQADDQAAGAAREEGGAARQARARVRCERRARGQRAARRGAVGARHSDPHRRAARRVLCARAALPAQLRRRVAGAARLAARRHGRLALSALGHAPAVAARNDRRVDAGGRRRASADRSAPLSIVVACTGVLLERSTPNDWLFSYFLNFCFFFEKYSIHDLLLFFKKKNNIVACSNG